MRPILIVGCLSCSWSNSLKSASGLEWMIAVSGECTRCSYTDRAAASFKRRNKASGMQFPSCDRILGKPQAVLLVVHCSRRSVSLRPTCEDVLASVAPCRHDGSMSQPSIAVSAQQEYRLASRAYSLRHLPWKHGRGLLGPESAINGLKSDRPRRQPE